jgi:hypothetical protein
MTTRESDSSELSRSPFCSRRRVSHRCEGSDGPPADAPRPHRFTRPRAVPAVAHVHALGCPVWRRDESSAQSRVGGRARGGEPARAVSILAGRARAPEAETVATRTALEAARAWPLVVARHLPQTGRVSRLDTRARARRGRAQRSRVHLGLSARLARLFGVRLPPVTAGRGGVSGGHVGAPRAHPRRWVGTLVPGVPEPDGSSPKLVDSSAARGRRPTAVSADAAGADVPGAAQAATRT